MAPIELDQDGDDVKLLATVGSYELYEYSDGHRTIETEDGNSFEFSELVELVEDFGAAPPTQPLHRHPSTLQVLRWFEYEHLPYGPPRDVSRKFAHLARRLPLYLADGPELTACLRKLLEAKDCAVRQAIADHQDDPRELDS